MTRQYIRFVCLLILSAFVGPAYCDWSGTWTLDANSEYNNLQNLGPGPNPTSDTSPYAPSLSINKVLSGNADGLYNNGTINAFSQATMTASGTHFGISTNAKVDDTTSGYGGANYMEADATLNLVDFMTCITDTNHHRIRMTSYWQINGSLTSSFTGHYGPPGTLDYVNAGARSLLQISGTGVGAAPYGGELWGDSYHSLDSNLTINPDNYQKDPPAAIPITLFFENNVPESYLLQVNAYSIAAVYNRDINGQGGSAKTALDMSHTFTWGGITSVTDADTGEPIMNWTLTSASGTDWATLATPEPSSLVCAISALILVALRCRKLKTSQTVSLTPY